MKRMISVFALAMALITVLSGCSMVEINAERDGQTVVAVVNGKDILKKDFVQNFQRTLIQSGMDPNDLSTVADEYVAYYAASSLESMVNQEVMLFKAKEMGLDTLNEQEQAEADKEFEEAMATMRDTARVLLAADNEEQGKTMTDEEIEQAVENGVNNTLATMGFDQESFRSYMEMFRVMDKVQAAVTKGIEPAQEDIETTYNERAASVKSSYDSSPSSYETAYMDGSVIYYVPSGTRIVSHILISLTDEQTEELATYRAEGKEEAADSVRANYLKEIETEANEVLAKVKADPESYMDMMKEHSDDVASKDGSTFAVASESASYYPKAFAKAAMGLKEVGEMTDLVVTDNGYHIIRCEEIPASGPVPMSNVYDTIYNELRDTLINEKMGELLVQWRTEYSVQLFTDRLV